MSQSNYLGLRQSPFQNDLDLEYFFKSQTAEEARLRIFHAVEQGKHLCLLTGEPGSGKTMWANYFLDELNEDRFEAFMLLGVPGGVEPGWLISRVGRGLGLEGLPEDRSAMLAKVYDALAAVRDAHRQTVVIVDEAQALNSPKILGELQALLNLEYEDRGLLSLVLVGQPNVRRMIIDDPVLHHRVDVRTELSGLGEAEQTAYLIHRVQVAGAAAGLLEPQALGLIGSLGEGMPRRMNTLADNALFEAQLVGESMITVRAVKKAALDLGLSEEPQVTSERVEVVEEFEKIEIEGAMDVTGEIDLSASIPHALDVEDELDVLLRSQEDETMILEASEVVAPEPIELEELVAEPGIPAQGPPKDEEDEILDSAFADLLDS